MPPELNKSPAGATPGGSAPKPPGVGTVPPPAPVITDQDILKPMDTKGLRKRIYDHAFEAVQNLEPMANSRHRLRIENPRWIDPETWGPSHQKKVFYNGGTLARRIAGDWVLEDAATNKEISRKSATIASVPHLNDRGMFLLNGSHWHLGSQTRLDPGVYPRIQANGEVEAYVNPKGGRQHRVALDPESGVFHLNIGSSHIPLMPILKALGATNQQLHDTWGRDLVVKNAAKDDSSVVNKLVKKLYEDRDVPEGVHPSKLIADKLSAMKLDPYVMGKTIGKKHEQYGLDALLDTTKRLLSINRGESEASERDHQAFQHILGPEHLFAERIKNSRPVLNPLLWRSTFKGNLDHIPSGALNRHIAETITGTGLGVNAQMTNPAEALDAAYRVSKMGSGGISSLDAVPDACYDKDTQVFTKEGWKYWVDVTEDTEFACRIDGAMHFHKSLRLHQEEYSGVLYGIKTLTLDHLVTPKHRVWCRKYRGCSGVKRCGQAPWGFELARDTHRKPREFSISSEPYAGKPRNETISLPEVLMKRAKPMPPIKFADWAELVGWYAAEGHIGKGEANKKQRYAISIAQSQSANPDKVGRIAALLSRLGVKWSYQAGGQFVIYARQANAWLSEHVGVGSINKKLPDGFIDWPLEARQRLYEALVAGDGHTKPNGYVTYTSTSKRLRDDFMLLATSLGLAVRELKIYPRLNNPAWNQAYQAGVLAIGHQGVTSKKLYDTAYYTQDYSGIVYCAEVPGGLLLVKRGRSIGMWSGNSRDIHSSQFHFIDPVVTPESGKAGVDTRFSLGSGRDKAGNLYTRVFDAVGRPKWATARDLQGKTVATGESRNSQTPLVEAMRDGEMTMVPRNQVHYYASPTEHGFSPVANMIPFKSASPPHRAAMGARMMTQALPLIDAESPLVQSGAPEGGSYEHQYGSHFGAVRAERPGRVVSVGSDAIKVRYQDGQTGDIPLHVHELYDHAPGRKTHFTQTPTIKPGDSFGPGQLLARSNYTDANGRVALGRNTRVAWLPARNGAAFEDAFAVSESYAKKKMVSDHMSLHSIEEPDAKFGKKDFRTLFPTKYTPDHLKQMDDNGVIKPGSVVQPGQPLILASKQSQAPRTTLVRSPKPIHQDASEIWDHDYPGQVVDVVKTRNGHRVSVKSQVPMQESDKISGRHGNKGIVTIIPDHQMPVGEDGQPFEMLASPYTLPTRKNDSQIAEVALGKIAAKTGKPYEIADYQKPDLMGFVNDELKKHGMKSTETVFDPVTGTKIPGVLTGNQFFMKLHHVVEDKLKQRDVGGYDSFGSPARGGEGGAKRMAMQDTFALLAHGATAFLRGSKLARGQRNEKMWEAILSGYTPPTPGVPMQYRRFIDSLKASGIHPVNENGKLRLKALTDEDVDRLAGDREIKNPGGIDWSKGGAPIKGGLFDHGLHGEAGDRWSKMSLHTPMPNPVFEDPVRYSLGLTEKEMRNVIAGKAGMANGKYVEPEEDQPLPRGFASGSQALSDSLKAIDLDKEIARAHDDIRGTKKTKRDLAIRKLKFLQGAADQGLHPSQWMLSKVPILPPHFRPVSKLQGSNTELISDPNYLYSDLWHANKNLRDLTGRVRDTSEEKLALYDALKAVSGLGDPINPKTQQKNIKGMLKLMLGDSPKWSLAQHKLLSSSVDLVGRSTIGPDAGLDMDEVGIPESMAFKVYGKFVTKRLVQGGMSPTEAVRSLNEMKPEARRALMKEMEERPVSYHRAPVLHKYGHIGAWPKLVKGDSIKLSPFVYKGLGGDNDGDTVNIHVPVYADEVKDITEKMMPSKNLLSVKDFAPHYKPEREFHVGLWQATEGQNSEGNRREKVFADGAALRRAFQNGEVSVRDKVVIMKH